MRDFAIKDRTARIELLQARQGLTEDQADVFTFALSDIRWSAIAIYDDRLPKVQPPPERTRARFRKLISDIREACRHIDHPLKDAKLPQLAKSGKDASQHGQTRFGPTAEAVVPCEQACL